MDDSIFCPLCDIIEWHLRYSAVNRVTFIIMNIWCNISIQHTHVGIQRWVTKLECTTMARDLLSSREISQLAGHYCERHKLIWWKSRYFFFSYYYFLLLLTFLRASKGRCFSRWQPSKSEQIVAVIFESFTFEISHSGKKCLSLSSSRHCVNNIHATQWRMESIGTWKSLASVFIKTASSHILCTHEE